MACVAVPLARDFEDSELTVPVDRLKNAGHEVIVFGATVGALLEGKRGTARVAVEKTARDLKVDGFDALVIPGGYSPDHLRLEKDIVSFVRRFWDSGKLVAAICHGPQLLIEANVVRGKTLTSWPSVRLDLENAGAKWVDRELVVDGNLITSRKPEDLEAFCNEILSRLEAVSKRRAAAGG
jgi:protease I